MLERMGRNLLKNPLRIIASILSGVIILLAWEGSFHAVQGNDPSRIVGSTAIFPFSAIVAERLSILWEVEAPIIERTGTGAGFKLFCSEKSPDSPGIVNASRVMNESERQLCFRNGITDVKEVTIGYGAIILATVYKEDKKDVTSFFISGLTLEDLYKGLAKNVFQDGKWIPNPYKNWKQINSQLPDIPIFIFGPPSTSGVRESMKDLIFQPFCNSFPQAQCYLLREDGRYIEVPENTKLIIKKMMLNPYSVGILGFPFWEKNQDILKSIPIEGILPSLEAIFKGSYPLTRLFYMYIKKEALQNTPSLKKFIKEFLSEDVWSEEGALAYKGLIPPSKEIREKSRKLLGN